MREDERQRQMDFILNNLAQISAKVDALSDAQLKSDQVQRANAVRIGRLEEAFVTLTQLSGRVA
jgi:Mg2+ and Co2+ transporter CorA